MGAGQDEDLEDKPKKAAGAEKGKGKDQGKGKGKNEGKDKGKGKLKAAAEKAAPRHPTKMRISRTRWNGQWRQPRTPSRRSLPGARIRRPPVQRSSPSEGRRSKEVRRIEGRR